MLSARVDRRSGDRFDRQMMGAWRNFKRWYRAHRRTILLVFLVLLFAGTMLAPYVLITVPAGHLGVKWERFFGGTVIGPALGEGLHPIFPWDRIYIYNARLQAHAETYDAVSKDGLSLKVEVTFRWRPISDNLAALHRDVGPNYLETLLIPEIGSIARRELAQHTWQDLVSEQREYIQTNILSCTVRESNCGSARADAQVREQSFVTRLVEPISKPPPKAFDYIGVKDVLISTVMLPRGLMDSIERKLNQNQIAEEYKFRLQREELESQRKAIEAKGIAAFQQTVQSGISETYLKWRGIEATLELARSPNAKVVVVGGQNGLPLILNTGDDLKGRAAAPAGGADTSGGSNHPNEPSAGPNVPIPPGTEPPPQPPAASDIPGPGVPPGPVPPLPSSPSPPLPPGSLPPPASGPRTDRGIGLIDEIGRSLTRNLGIDVGHDPAAPR